jgi:hypothetical protein
MGADKSISKRSGLEYLRYIWKAKGRHGTHSPFVYAFIEQVLRSKQPFPDFKNQEAYAGWKNLTKTIFYLETEKLLLFQPGLGSLHSLITTFHPRQKIITEKEMMTASEKTLIIIDAARVGVEELYYLKTREPASSSGIYFLNPHAAGGIFKKQEQFDDWDHYPMSLDFWDGILLYRHSDFREKQHFFLK